VAATRALDALAENDLAEGHVALADEARQAGDGALMMELLLEAQSRRASAAGVDRLRPAPGSLPAKPRKPHDKLGAALRDKAAALALHPADSLWAAYQKLPADRAVELRTMLLRTTLQRDPDHAGALAAVRAQLPAFLRVPEPFAPLDWLAAGGAAPPPPPRPPPP